MSSPSLALVTEIERRLRLSLDELHDDGARPPARLYDAMAYMLLSGGKRLRPLLVLESARAVAPVDERERALELAFPAALAVEYVHSYSLVHDDLPALDDDELRRGRPTLHVAFDEATAILAGDAMLADAFGFVARAERRAAEQCRELASAAGSAGMVGGQVDDMAAEGAALSGAELEVIHRRKTGRLFVACCALGGLAVDAPPPVIASLRAYGASFGLAFQIADDVLDVAGAAGKRGGRDQQREKATYVKAYGVEGAQRRAHDEAERAASIAAALGEAGTPLVELARLAAARTR